MHVGNEWIHYELRHLPRGIHENSNDCLIICVQEQGQYYTLSWHYTKDPVVLIYLVICLAFLYLLPLLLRFMPIQLYLNIF